MKKLLLIAMAMLTFLSVMPICAEETGAVEDNKGCVLEFDADGNVLNQEEYEACLAELVEPANGGGERGPRQ